MLKQTNKSVTKLILVAFITVIFTFSAVGCASQAKITPSEAKSIQYETFDNGLISIKIPKGWKVAVCGDYIHYTFRVYNPNNPLYQIFNTLKFEGFNKSYESKKKWNDLYGTSGTLSNMPIVNPQTTQGFYSIYSQIAALNPDCDLPDIKNFAAIESFGKSVFGGEVLRASFTDSKGNVGEGIFTASVMDPGSYMISGVDMYPLNVYNAMGISAPKAMLVEWEQILLECLSTLKYSDSFIKGFNSQEDAQLSAIIKNSTIYNQISDGIMDSWEKRQTSYDVISQKNSDATLGYDRIVDTKTGETYKADTGWIDTYKGKRYELITDDSLYTVPVSGYIESK